MARLGMLFIAMPVLAILLGALIPRNASWQEAGVNGVVIGLDASLAHTRIIVPVTTAGHDWRGVLPTGVVPANPGVTHLAFSWGERAFFLATPSWADFDLWLGLRALFASEASLVHIEPLAGTAGRRIRLTSAEHRRLVRFLRSEIGSDPPLPGYGTDDAFLPGTGRYSWWRTCNQWTADGLAAAGVRVGYWTPFAQGLMWRFAEKEDTHGGQYGQAAGLAAGQATGG